MIRIAVLVSGSGTNMQSLIENCKKGLIPGKVVLVISSNPEAFAIKRARKEKIPVIVLNRYRYKNDWTYSKRILKEVKDKKIDIICLAGFLWKLAPNIIGEYKERILNIHPTLLPRFGGKGMYGIRVHREVLKNREKFSGATVHFVDEKYDHGKIIIQKKVKVLKNDTAETLAKRILKIEHKVYPIAVKKVIEWLNRRKYD